MEKSLAAAAEDDPCSSLNRFPDDIILQIMKKIIDLKTLCICKLVTKRVSSIILQVDTISFTTPLENRIPYPVCFDQIREQVHSPEEENRYPFQPESFKSAMKSLNKFKLVKSLCIHLPSSCLEVLGDCYLFKWKLKFDNKKLEPYLFILSPSSTCDSKGKRLSNEGVNGFIIPCIPRVCFWVAVLWQRMLFGLIDDFPLLEKISITDLARKGRISVSCSRKINELRDDLMDVRSWCCIPLLEFPGSGYVMTGVTLFLLCRNSDSLENIDFDDEFEDEDEVAYSEAIKEIMKKHRDKLEPTENAFFYW